ncbi:MAG: rhodanese-like domain-containing protein [Pseudomonadota bacterium]|nr:rhodanese-like domain-containing protein [Pseudomonadota bacterium]
MRILSVRELKARLDAPAGRPQLLDVREPWEVHLCMIADSLHIPMDQVPARLPELDRSRQTVVICHHGIRSSHVARLLEYYGFTEVFNLTGGIDAWAREIDPGMTTY